MMINFLGTCVTIFSIRKILAIAKELASCYNKVKINRKILILHSVLITLNFGAVVTYGWDLGLGDSKIRRDRLFLMASVSDTIVQLFICLLCLTMGSDKKLRKFIMTVDVTIPGAPKLIWTRKLSVVSEIVAP